MTTRSRLPLLVRAGRASVASGARLASWADRLGRPAPEPPASRLRARLGGLLAVTVLVLYLAWRLGTTLPAGAGDRAAALALVAVEVGPLVLLAVRTLTLWTIDPAAPDLAVADAAGQAQPGRRAAVLVRTDAEPPEVVAASVAAACELRPAHRTWVLDGGDRPWVAELCARYGARHLPGEPGPAGGASGAAALDHALSLMRDEAAQGAEPVDVVAVLDCEHVPLPTFLTDTLGWFDDPRVALVQTPHSTYNVGAFDDDGESGEQAALFHVLMPARDHDGSGPYWCGSGGLLRTEAVAAVGGVTSRSAAADVDTTVQLLRAGWRTRYHHQVVAVGLAPETPEQYLLQRRQWAEGALQVVAERGWTAPRRGLSWRAYACYLRATLWWLDGVALLAALAVPAVVLLSGARTTTASPLAVLAAFLLLLAVLLWAPRQQLRQHLHWPTACALFLLRVPLGLSCLARLLRGRAAHPAAGPEPVDAGRRLRRHSVALLWLLLVVVAATLGYGLVGVTGAAPWHLPATSTLAAGLWLLLALTALVVGLGRIADASSRTSRRRAYRAPVRALVTLNGLRGELVDVSVGGVAVRLPPGAVGDGAGAVTLQLPGASELTLEVVRLQRSDDVDQVSLQVRPGDWAAYRVLVLWLFHTPPGVVDGLPPHAPAVAATDPCENSRRPLLVRQHG